MRFVGWQIGGWTVIVWWLLTLMSAGISLSTSDQIYIIYIAAFVRPEALAFSVPLHRRKG
jgi:hypothetical protein